MVLWIVVGLLAGGVLVLVVAIAFTAARLPELRRAMRRVQNRRVEAERTQRELADMQATLGLLQARAMRTSEHLAALREARANGETARSR